MSTVSRKLLELLEVMPHDMLWSGAELKTESHITTEQLRRWAINDHDNWHFARNEFLGNLLLRSSTNPTRAPIIQQFDRLKYQEEMAKKAKLHSESRAAIARENGKKGGRPPKNFCKLCVCGDRFVTRHEFKMSCDKCLLPIKAYLTDAERQAMQFEDNLERGILGRISTRRRN